MFNKLCKSDSTILEISELFNLVWNSSDFEKIQSKTEWAFANDFSKILLYSHNSQLIAARGGIFWPLMIGKKKINAIQFHGTCVHPEYRRKGIFTSINKDFLKEAEQEGLEFIFNVSVDNSRDGYEKLGWKYIKGFRRLTYIKKPMSLILKNWKKNHEEFNDDEEKTTIDVSNEFILARNNKLKKTIHSKYTSEFLKWRLSNKNENYREVRTKDVLIIYKVLIKNRAKEIIIGECFLLEYKFKLFSEAINVLLKKEKPHIIYTYIFNTHPCYSFFIKKFFLPNPKRYNLNFGTKLLNLSLQNDIKSNKWAISFLDIDTF